MKETPTLTLEGGARLGVWCQSLGRVGAALGPTAPPRLKMEPVLSLGSPGRLQVQALPMLRSHLLSRFDSTPFHELSGVGAPEDALSSQSSRMEAPPQRMRHVRCCAPNQALFLA